MVGYSGLSGHCAIGDFVTISGHSGVHQFVRIGVSAFVGALSGVENDVIPFGMALGNRARSRGLNIVGLQRRGIEKSRIYELRIAYRDLFAGLARCARAWMRYMQLAVTSRWCARSSISSEPAVNARCACHNPRRDEAATFPITRSATRTR